MKHMATNIKSRLGGYSYQMLKKHIQLKKLNNYPFTDNPLRNSIAENFKVLFKAFFYQQ